ncbi:MAG: hypothetical protein NVSMB64_25270 [Candidatus Velthaea sp.]
MQRIFNEIFSLALRDRLRPQISYVIRSTTEFNGNEMIDDLPSAL